MLTKTNLLWDKYIDYLIFEVANSNFSRRAEIKPMASPKAPEDSHVTSRFMHELLVALLARKIAKDLDLNGEYAFGGMLGHDAGHTPGAHEGETIFNLITRIYNTGYFHHNAKSVEVILEEDICNKAIDRIPGIENKPELRKQLQEEFYGFLDIVISHDGEATKADEGKKTIEYPSYKEAVLAKLKLSNSQNEYKHIAQDPEGLMAKISDVLGYLPTDILDGFRLKIITDFNDDYLEAFGDMFSEENGLTKEEKITKGKEVLLKYQQDTLRKQRGEIANPNNQEILQYALESLKSAENKASEQKRKVKDVLGEEGFINEEKKKLEEKLRDNGEGGDYTKEQFLSSKLNKYVEFMKNFLKVSTDAASAITRKMQLYFINDFVQHSKEKGELGFSPKADRLFYKMKALNYKYIVQYSRWDYQTDVLPEAIKQLVQIIKMGLINSGTIRDMFFDEDIRESIEGEALGFMITKEQAIFSYDDYKRQIEKGRYCGNVRDISRNILLKEVIDFTRKKGKIFANTYMNVFNAIPYTVRDNVNNALNNEISVTSYLTELQKESNDTLRRKMILKYGSIEAARTHKVEFIGKLVEEERKNMEEKLAIQMAVDYLGGMTDQSLSELAIKTGIIPRESIINGTRGRVSENVLYHLNRLGEDNPGELDSEVSK